EGDARHVGSRERLDREAHAIDTDRAVQYRDLGDGLRQADVQEDVLALRINGEDGAEPVDVALDEVAAETVAERQRPLEVDAAAGRERPERGDRERGRDGDDGEAGVIEVDDGLAGAVDGNGVAVAQALEHAPGLDLEAEPGLERLGAAHASDFLDDPGEHPPTSPVLSWCVVPLREPKGPRPGGAARPPAPAGI